jgi:5-oxopent-3-ene-1,2,5-tricarboxylate decarboxylase / 2-hydroxyhepta-2,4-diene-1,7-dioate isomerase
MKTAIQQRIGLFSSIAGAVLCAAAIGTAQAPTFRLLTFEVGTSGPRLGATRGSGEQEIVDVQNALVYLARTNATALRGLAPVPPDMRSLIEAGSASISAARTTYDAMVRLKASGGFTEPGAPMRVFYPSQSVTYLPPITNPSKIFGGAGAYQRKNPNGTPGTYDNVEYPSFFLKPPSSLTGHESDINLDGLVTTGVHESEMAAIIGRTARDVPEAQAMDYVMGYTILNDVSARDLAEGKHASQGSMIDKGLDTFSPMGPYITLKEDVPNPHNLEVYALVDGVRHKWTVNNGNTSFLTFTVPQVIAYLSERITLVPGDVISLGVPEPTIPLKEGQTIEIVIQGLGTLRNHVVSKPAPGHVKFPPRKVSPAGTAAPEGR